MRHCLWFFLVLYTGSARGDAALFLQEPYGAFGRMNPTGHAAVYLSRVCAESPVRVRPCAPGEAGSVISRYHRVGGYDWIAIPLIPYLYAVDQPADVPLFATEAAVVLLRDQYRRRHLESIAPDEPGGGTPDGEWTQLIGAAYDRRLYSFEIETTEEQDARMIEKLNSSHNRARFNLLFRNCADFSRTLLNTAYPHAVRRSLFADQGITTPKQVAKSLVSYARRHPDLRFSGFAIAQVPGTLPRSGSVRGVFESFLKSKKYVLPLAVLHPLITAGMAVVYVTQACSDPHRNLTRQLDSETHPAAVMARLQMNGAGPAVDFGATSTSE